MRFTRTEIGENVTPLVASLAAHYWQVAVIRAAPLSLIDLCQRARALLEPIDDWASAARAAGWMEDPGDTPGRVVFDTTKRNGEDESYYHAESWEAACRRMKLEPSSLPVTECWTVTEWMADRLEEMGERVMHDFAGLTIWARTGTEPLASDELLRDIWRHVGEGQEGRA